jgi:precorrin-6A/cobalt-precorrin-6A reductase
MHEADGAGDGKAVWLIAGTGEGPVLARRLLARGWQVQVSVVSRGATAVYPKHPCLRLRVGSIDGAGGVARELDGAAAAGRPFRWVIDATHPFAGKISALLLEVCASTGQPLLRLHRPDGPRGDGILLDGPADLRRWNLAGEAILLAIGARRLADMLLHCPGALHHARLLPRAEALRTALAAGLAPQRVACLQPGGDFLIEKALCRHWRIGTVLCRQSGGVTEAGWRWVCSELGLRLFLLRRPIAVSDDPGLDLETLLRTVAWPSGRGSG